MISVIVPVFNEENSVGPFLLKLSKELSSIERDHEIIVVNDGSDDGSLEKIKNTNIPSLRTIEHAENIGYGKSLLDGILAAKNECIVIIDADNSYPPEKIKELYSYYPSFDMIVGARQGTEYRKGMFKRPARLIFKFLAKYATGRDIPDVNSGLRIFKKSIVLSFREMLCTGFSFTTTITLLFMLNHHFVKYVSVDYNKRDGKSKVKHFKDTLRAGQIIIQSIVHYNPIKLFLLIANFCGICAVVLGIANFYYFNSLFITLLSAMLAASYVPIFALGLAVEALRKP